MPISIQIPTVLRRFIQNQDSVVVDARTVNDALAQLIAQSPGLQKHLFDDSGKLRSFVNIYLHDQDVRYLNLKYESKLEDGDILTIVPAIAGGAGKELPNLTAQEQRQYSRHLILPEVGIFGQRKLKASSVLVVGAGGLGSPLLAYLAAAGVGIIGIVDGDVVDETNLQRQIIHGFNTLGISKLQSAKSFINNLNPNVEVKLYETFFTSETAFDIARDYDLLIDGTDNFPTRYLVNDVAYFLGKPNVYGSIFRFEGQASVFCAPNGPCYRCLYPEPPPPGLVPSCAEGGVLGVLPGIIGSLQANEALKLLLEIGNPLSGRLLRFDALTMKFSEFVLKKNPDCPLCGEKPSITELIDYNEFCGVVPYNDRFVPEQHRVSATQLAKILQNGNGYKPFLLDVRNELELDIANIEGFHLIPLPELEERIDEIDRSKDVLILCRSGVRSAKAYHILKHFGFENVFNIHGGILAWSDEVDPAVAKY